MNRISTLFFLGAVGAFGAVLAVPRTSPSVPVVNGKVTTNAVLTDSEGIVFLEFLRDTYIVDLENQTRLRGGDGVTPALLKKLREGSPTPELEDEADPSNESETPDDITETAPETAADEPEVEADLTFKNDRSLESRDPIENDFGQTGKPLADYLENKDQTLATAQFWTNDTEILPPEIIKEPKPNRRPYTELVTAFEVYNAAFRDVAFTDSSRSRTKGVKVLMVPPEGAGRLQLWEWIDDDHWQRVGGRTQVADGSDVPVFTAYIAGTGTFAVYDEAPQSSAFDPISQADDPIRLKPFTVPQPLNEDEAINFHLMEVERYEFLKEALGKDKAPVPPAENAPEPLPEGDGDERDAPMAEDETNADEGTEAEETPVAEDTQTDDDPADEAAASPENINPPEPLPEANEPPAEAEPVPIAAPADDTNMEKITQLIEANLPPDDEAIGGETVPIPQAEAPAPRVSESLKADALPAAKPLPEQLPTTGGAERETPWGLIALVLCGLVVGASFSYGSRASRGDF